MTDIVTTAANVAKGTGAKTRRGILGATVTAGQVICRDATTRKFVLVDADGAAGIRGPGDDGGIALNGGADGQPVEIQYEGGIDLGATLVVGTIYVASDTPGGIMPAADLETGDYVTVLGVATAADNLKMGIVESGAAVPAP